MLRFSHIATLLGVSYQRVHQLHKACEAVPLLIVVAVLGTCTQFPEGECFEFCGGRIKGVFHTGDRTIPDSRWVEMIELSGPPEDRCGPDDCGMNYGALRVGAYWEPGKWRVIPPHLRGWTPPDPIVVIIEEEGLTTFEASYHRDVR
jgi:hypothetical protein